MVLSYAQSAVIDSKSAQLSSSQVEGDQNYGPHPKYYHTLPHINNFLNNLQNSAHPYVRVLKTFRSKQGRDIPLVVLSNFTATSEEAAKRHRVLLVYGAHPREFLPVESALYFLANVSSSLLPNGTHVPQGDRIKFLDEKVPFQRLEDKSVVFSHFLVRHFSVFLLPLWNPDGRARVESEKTYCSSGNADGVNLDHNFQWNFVAENKTVKNVMGIMETEIPGAKAFSEMESQVLLNILNSHDFQAVIHFHSGAFQVVAPYSDSLSFKQPNLRPPQIQNILSLANKLSTTFSSSGSSDHKPQTNQAYPLFPSRMVAGEARTLLSVPQDGTLVDYAAGLVKVPYALNVFLWSSPTIEKSPSLQGSTQDMSKACFGFYNPPNYMLHQVLAALHPLYINLFETLHGQHFTNNKEQLDKQHQVEMELKKSESATLPEALLFLLRTFFYFSVVFSIIGVFLLRKYWPQVKYYFRGRRIVNTRNFGTHYFNYMKYM